MTPSLRWTIPRGRSCRSCSNPFRPSASSSNYIGRRGTFPCMSSWWPSTVSSSSPSKASRRRRPPQCTCSYRCCSTHVDRPIVDGTGLNGYYDFPSLREIFLEHPDSALALSTLLRESFGLELKPEKESMDVLIVDHVQRPSPN